MEWNLVVDWWLNSVLGNIFIDSCFYEASSLMAYYWINVIVLAPSFACALQCEALRRVRKVSGPIRLKYIEGI